MKKLLIGAAAVAFAAVPAIAQQAPPPGVAQGTTPAWTGAARPQARPPITAMPDAVAGRAPMVSARVITRDEVVAHVRRMFARLDANHDGFVTRDELAAMRRETMSAGNPLGRAQQGPRSLGREARFDQLDTNHDGMISRQEFLAARPQMRQERIVMMRTRANAGPDMMGMQMRGGMGMGMGIAGHLFAMADANHDGRVSLDEATQAALRHFDTADLNHDGKLTPEERRQARASMQGRRRPI